MKVLEEFGDEAVWSLTRTMVPSTTVPAVLVDPDEDEGVIFENHNQDSDHEEDEDESGTEFDDDESNDTFDEEESSSAEDDSQEFDLHLNPQEIHAEVTASLTAILQTALNLAASENECKIPVFGIWGDYQSSEKTGKRNVNAVPSWIPSGLECNLLQLSDSFTRSGGHGARDPRGGGSHHGGACSRRSRDGGSQRQPIDNCRQRRPAMHLRAWEAFPQRVLHDLHQAK